MPLPLARARKMEIRYRKPPKNLAFPFCPQGLFRAILLAAGLRRVCGKYL